MNEAGGAYAPPQKQKRANKHMDALSTALREIAETKHLLESLISSSESFDYPKAKTALKELSSKIRELAKARAKLEALQRSTPGNIHVLDFTQGTIG